MPAPNNLPQQLTNFIGRGQEIAAIEQLLLSTRLLSLTGTGGTGKTRLAMEVADLLLDAGQYPDGVWFVELAALSDPALVPQAVASVLGLREEMGRPLLDALLDYLQPLKVLLVIDNCEHMVVACARLAADLLLSCPGLAILATTREALDINGETTWRVPTLSAPLVEHDEPLSDGDVARYEAVQLFVDRARLRRPDFAVTNENARAVAQLCQRLDGIPLAIELAAARIKVLSLEQIVERLDERFKLLTSGSRTGLPRQQTLQALMDWSYDLLSMPEQELLRALSVFAGSFTLDAMQAVCSLEGTSEQAEQEESPHRIDNYELIDLLGRLVDKSLVIKDEHRGEARYRLLETIRQYAWTKLEQASEEARHAPDPVPPRSVSAVRHSAIFRRHRDWYLDLSEHAEDALLSQDQALWLDRLETEHDNLRLALAWSRDEQGEAEGGLRLAGSLVWFWYFRGYLSEGRGWMETMLALPGAEMSGWPRAKALNTAGVMAYLQCDYAAARTRLEESLTIWRTMGDGHTRGTAFALGFLGLVAMRQGNRAARQLAEESVVLFREIGDNWGLALSLDFLGEVALAQGGRDAARDLHNESLALYRQIGNKWGIALELSNFGREALRDGRYDEAQALLTEALAIQREVGDRWIIAWTMHNLGDVARSVGESEQAAALYGDSLALFEQLGDRGGIASSLHMLGRCALGNREWARAAPLFEDSLALSRELGDRRIVAYTLSDLGYAHLQQGDYQRAYLLFVESLSLLSGSGGEWTTSIQFNWLGVITQSGGREGMAALYGENLQRKEGTGDGELLVGCIQALAHIAAAAGEHERAARLLGAMEALGEELGIPSPPMVEVDMKGSVITGARGSLGAREYAAAVAEGRAMDVPEALSLALQSMSIPPLAPKRDAPGSNERDRQHYPGDLTHREVEVLRLLAEGLPDNQLAARLSLSTRTVHAHVRSIYSKLGVTNRSGATRFAIEHNLTRGA